jgi:hypothetical protein
MKDLGSSIQMHRVRLHRLVLGVERGMKEVKNLGEYW